jgi:hypothetical protein
MQVKTENNKENSLCQTEYAISANNIVLLKSIHSRQKTRENWLSKVTVENCILWMRERFAKQFIFFATIISTEGGSESPGIFLCYVIAQNH